MDTDPLSLSADLGALDEAQDFLSQRATEAGLESTLQDRLALALEEVFVNICQHAYPEDTSGTVELSTWTDGARFILEIRDQAPPFDGLSLPDPDTSAALEARAVGGLGWFLVRRLVSEIQYRREDSGNRVRLIMAPDPDDHIPKGTA